MAPLDGAASGASGTGVSWTVWQIEPAGRVLRAEGEVRAAGEHGIALNLRGSHLAAWGFDPALQWIDVGEGGRLAFPAEHRATCAAWVADGRRLVVGDQGGYARTIDAASGRVEVRARLTRHALRCLAVSPDDRLVVGGGYAVELAAASLPNLEVLWSRRVADPFLDDEDFVSSVVLLPGGQGCLVGTGTW
jgi:hypothetical protein